MKLPTMGTTEHNRVTRLSNVPLKSFSPPRDDDDDDDDDDQDDASSIVSADTHNVQQFGG